MHLILHFVVPLALAWTIARGPTRIRQFFVAVERPAWQIFAGLLAGLVIDVDHLLADPIYDPERCSIGFHPLHQDIAIGAYALLFIPRRTRVVALGLALHIALDALDCLRMG